MQRESAKVAIYRPVARDILFRFLMHEFSAPMFPSEAILAVRQRKSTDLIIISQEIILDYFDKSVTYLEK